MSSLTNRLTEDMKNEFGNDNKRISHSLSVLEHAKDILKEEGGDSKVVIASALLHDIGIHEAERKYGSSSGKYQEIEGPPIARRILECTELESSVIDHVCSIVGSHHSGSDIDTPEFRILWDADWLVNIPDVFKDSDKDKLEGIIGKIFKTKTGKKKAYKLFLEKKTL